MPNPLRRRTSYSLLIALAIYSTVRVEICRAGHPTRNTVPFSLTQDVGSGNEVFVSGAHRDLTSGGIQPWGVKLRWSTGNVWSGSIAIEAGAQITYTYSSHANSTSGFCSGNSTAIGQPVNLTVSSAPGPPYSAKFIRYLSSWSSANLQFRDITQNGTWTQVAMQRVGQGRTSAENVFEMAAVAQPADEIEFVFSD